MIINLNNQNNVVKKPSLSLKLERNMSAQIDSSLSKSKATNIYQKED